MFPSRAIGSNTGRDIFLEREGSNICSDRSLSLTHRRGILLNAVSGSQEEWEYETGDQPEALNKWVETPHFKMEGLPTLRDLLRQGDWLVKVDLKDAYFTVPVHTDHQPYLRFVIV